MTRPEAPSDVTSGLIEPAYEAVDTPTFILGLIVGPTRTHPDVKTTAGSGDVWELREPRHTCYVLIERPDAQLEVQRWNPELHPPLGDIPPIGGAIGEFMNQIEGMGEMGEPLGRRFRQVQRASGSAMRTYDSEERKIRRRGGDPRRQLDKSGGRALEEHPEHPIPFPDDSFLFDASAREIRRVVPEKPREL